MKSFFKTDVSLQDCYVNYVKTTRHLDLVARAQVMNFKTFLKINGVGSDNGSIGLMCTKLLQDFFYTLSILEVTRLSFIFVS